MSFMDRNNCFNYPKSLPIVRREGDQPICGMSPTFNLPQSCRSATCKSGSLLSSPAPIFCVRQGSIFSSPCKCIYSQEPAHRIVGRQRGAASQSSRSCIAFHGTRSAFLNSFAVSLELLWAAKDGDTCILPKRYN